MRIFLIDNDKEHFRIFKDLLEDTAYLKNLHDKFTKNLKHDFEDPEICMLEPMFKEVNEDEIAGFIANANKTHDFNAEDFYVVDTLLTSSEHSKNKTDMDITKSSGYILANRLVDEYGIPSERIRLISKFILLNATVEPFGKIIRKPFMVGREKPVLDRGELSAYDYSLPVWLREYGIISDFKNQIYYGALKPMIEAQ